MKVKVTKLKNGQYRITIPKAIAEALNLEGKMLDVKLQDHKIILEVEDEAQGKQ